MWHLSLILLCGAHGDVYGEKSSLHSIDSSSSLCVCVCVCVCVSSGI
jgi:hypothetical protein